MSAPLFHGYRKPDCRHYVECLDGAARRDDDVFDCGTCDRFEPGEVTLDVADVVGSVKLLMAVVMPAMWKFIGQFDGEVDRMTIDFLQEVIHERPIRTER